MGANEGTTTNTRYFKLIAKAEKAEPNGKKVICEMIKKGDKYEQGKWFAGINGVITNTNVKEYDFENEKKLAFSITLSDKSGNYNLAFSLNFATFGIINALLNADTSKPIEITGWIGKTGYVGAGVRYAGDTTLIKWAIDLDKQPKGDKYKTPSGKEEVDYTNVKKFWHAKFLTLKHDNIVKVETPDPIAQSSSLVNDDDLPF